MTRRKKTEYISNRMRIMCYSNGLNYVGVSNSKQRLRSKSTQTKLPKPYIRISRFCIFIVIIVIVCVSFPHAKRVTIVCAVMFFMQITWRKWWSQPKQSTQRKSKKCQVHWTTPRISAHKHATKRNPTENIYILEKKITQRAFNTRFIIHRSAILSDARQSESEEQRKKQNCDLSKRKFLWQQYSWYI